jgi:hypothetical protein
MSLPNSKKLFFLTAGFILGYLTVFFTPKLAHATDFFMGKDTDNNFIIKELVGATTPTPTGPIFKMDNTGAINNARMNASQVSGGTFGGTPATGDFTFPVNLKIPNGNVGIGTTVPASLLDVKGILNVHAGYSSVGIGTTSPQSRLDIVGNGTHGITYTANLGNLSALKAINSGGYEVAKIEVAGSEGFGRLVLRGGSSSNDDIDIKGSGVSVFNAGNVGIGTTGPGAKLDIADAAELRMYGSTGNSGKIHFRVNDIGTDTNMWQNSGILQIDTEGKTGAVAISTGGNVGIGTTGPGANLHVVKSGGQAMIDLEDNATGGTPTNSHWRLFADKVGGGGGNLTFGLYDTTNMRLPFGIDNSGNVGIGTTAPGEKLHVLGTQTSGYNTPEYVLKLDATTNSLASIANGFGVGIDFHASRGSSDNAARTGWIASYLVGGAQTTDDLWGLKFGVRDNDTERESLVILNSGNVGIGTTAPSTKLHVSSATALDGITATDGTRWTLEFAGTHGAGAYNGIVADNDNGFIYSGGTQGTGGFVIAPWAAATSGIRMDGSGNVGIGTTVPRSTLDLGGGITTPKFLVYAAGNDKWGFGVPGDATFRMFTGSGANLTFGTISTADGTTWSEKMRITNAGYVGIGTAGPAYKLHVNGTIYAQASLYVEGGHLFYIFDGIPHDAVAGYDTYLRLNPDLGFSSGVYTPGAFRADGNVTFNGTATFAGLVYGNLKTQWLESQIDAGYNVGTSTHRYAEMHAVVFKGSLLAGPDLAESYKSDDKTLEPGTLVSWDNNNAIKITKALKENSTELAGVISSNPGIMLSDESGYSKEGSPLSLTGRAPVKVSIQNGNIKVGDPLTISDTPGVAMKATGATKIIGRALENFDGTISESYGVYVHMIKHNTTPDPYKASPAANNIGKIMAFVKVEWYDPSVFLTDTGTLKIVGNENGTYTVKSQDDSAIDRIGAFAEVVSGKIRSGIVEAKKVIADGVDVGKKLVELEDKVNQQQKQIDSLKQELDSLKKDLESLKNK